MKIQVLRGRPARVLISNHIALNGDDGSIAGEVSWRQEGTSVVLQPAEGGDLARRFANGSFVMAPADGSKIESVGSDELLFADGRSRRQPYLCIVAAAAKSFGLSIRGNLVTESVAIPKAVNHEQLVELLGVDAPAG